MKFWIVPALAVALGLILAAVRPRTPLRELPLLLPLSQLALVALVTTALLHQGKPTAWLWHLVPTVLAGVLSDWMLLRVFRRIRRREALQQQVDVLEQELSRQEERSRELLASSEGLRHLRHDLHNQLQTAALLLERGAAEEARALLEQLRDFLEQTPEREESDHCVSHSDLR